MSTFHLWFVAPRPNGWAQPRGGRRLGDLAWPGRGRMLIDSPRPGTSLRVLLRRRRLNLLQTEAFYLLEKLPEDHRPEYLALYNLALNAALLLDSLTGPFIAGFVGVRTALAIFAVLRFLAALAILRWE